MSTPEEPTTSPDDTPEKPKSIGEEDTLYTKPDFGRSQSFPVPEQETPTAYAAIQIPGTGPGDSDGIGVRTQLFPTTLFMDDGGVHESDGFDSFALRLKEGEGEGFQVQIGDSFDTTISSGDGEPLFDVAIVGDEPNDPDKIDFKDMHLQARKIDPTDAHIALTDEQYGKWNTKFDSSPAAWESGVAEIVEQARYKKLGFINAPSLHSDPSERKFPGIFKTADALEVFCAGMRTKKAEWKEKANDDKLSVEDRAGYTGMVNMIDSDVNYKYARGLKSYYKELEQAVGHGMNISGEKACQRMITHHILAEFGYDVTSSERNQKKALIELNKEWKNTIDDFESDAADPNKVKPNKEAYDHAVFMKKLSTDLVEGKAPDLKKTPSEFLKKHTSDELKLMRDREKYDEHVNKTKAEMASLTRKLEQLERANPESTLDIAALTGDINKLQNSIPSNVGELPKKAGWQFRDGLYRTVFDPYEAIDFGDGKKTHLLGKYARRALSWTGKALDTTIKYGSLGIYWGATGGHVFESLLTSENYTAGDVVSTKLRGVDVDLSLDASAGRREDSYFSFFKSRWNPDPTVTITTKNGMTKMNMKLNHSVNTLNALNKAQLEGGKHPKYDRLLGDMSRFVDISLRKGLGSTRANALKISSKGKDKTQGAHDIYRRMAFTDLKARAMVENKTLYAVNKDGITVPITPTSPEDLIKNNPNSLEAQFLKNELMTIPPKIGVEDAKPSENMKFNDDLNHYLEKHGQYHKKHIERGLDAVDEAVTAKFSPEELKAMEKAELRFQTDKIKADSKNIIPDGQEALSPEAIALKEQQALEAAAATAPAGDRIDVRPKLK